MQVPGHHTDNERFTRVSPISRELWGALIRARQACTYPRDLIEQARSAMQTTWLIIAERRIRHVKRYHLRRTTGSPDT